MSRLIKTSQLAFLQNFCLMKIKFILLFLLVVGLVSCNQNVSQLTLEERALKIHDQFLTVDSHTDTPLELMTPGFNISLRHDYLETGTRVDFPRMKEGGMDAMFFAVFLGQGKRDSANTAKATRRAEMIFDSIHANLKRYPDLAQLALSPEDAYSIKKSGKRAVFIGIENGYPIGNDLSLIKHFYERGARYITLCHTRNNDICDSSNDSLVFGGLSEFGEKVVAEMNRVGMMIDVSHISDSSFYDVIALSKAPVIASHSCARALCDNKRNLNDSMLVKLAENGGVIQMCILSAYVKKFPPNAQRDSAEAAMRIKYRNFLDLSDEERLAASNEWHENERKFPEDLAKVSDAVDHIDHIVKIAGINHVGIGTDFDGGGELEDCHDVSQMKNITIELLRRGYSDEDIRKIWGENLMRVMREVEKTAQKLS